jgi:malate dehydrogenase (oxaloacetate-decarboxylating)
MPARTPCRPGTARPGILRPMRPLSPPFDRIAAGEPAAVEFRGASLLNRRLLTKDLAFDDAEREALELRGLLPAQVLSIDAQLALELEHMRRKPNDLERYVGLAALQDRNATLFYRLLVEHLEECLPIVYTPTVGRACQEFSHIMRRTRGLWITPDDVDRIPAVLRNSPYTDVRLIVVTDNERILGLGDQGAGGMPIPIGKLALYTAGSGIYPGLTLPVSLDVGTDNQGLLEDPLYAGWRHPRLRGPDYDALVEAFVRGVQEVWPGCLIQFEDFKQGNALRLLARYRDQTCCFNDDVQGTSAIVLAGVLAATEGLDRQLPEQRIVLLGAGAAGVGIARLLRIAMAEAGADETALARAIVLLDSHGLLRFDRHDLDPAKAELAMGPTDLAAYGLAEAGNADLETVVRAVRPTVLVGTTGKAGTFTEGAIRAMAEGADRPVIMPLSNPTDATEATPAQLAEWTAERALIATGSPFPPLLRADGTEQLVGQANNVFVFPGVGLGAIVAESRGVTDQMFLAAAREVAALVTPRRFEAGALYPPVGELRAVSRRIAIAVAEEARQAGLAGIGPEIDLAAEVAAAMWWPEYVPYRAI